MTAREALARRTETENMFLVERAAALQSVTDDDRTATFVASDETVDRYGDIVSVGGWDLANYRKNPIVLWMHRQYDLPIGQAKVWVENEKLMATIKFHRDADNPQAERVWSLVKRRQLRALSVGFTANEKDIEPIRDQNERTTGYRFLKQELLEVSVVNVPANPAALQVARSLALPESFIREALPLDALVRDEQAKVRQRLAALQLAGICKSAPR
jgi:HK97 family phage prohead protease